ncbi:hypothetical protein [Pseudoalteromonas rubra]|nr:hypothetical protein [Pseudoalteromonas rubra]
MEGLLHALMLDGQGGVTPVSDLTQALKDEVPLWRTLTTPRTQFSNS